MRLDPPLVTRAIPKWFTKPEDDNVRTGVVTAEMYRALLPHLRAHASVAFVIAYHLGMMRGEILALRWAQIDFDVGLIRLFSAPPAGRLGSMNSYARDFPPATGSKWRIHILEAEGNPQFTEIQLMRDLL